MLKELEKVLAPQLAAVRKIDDELAVLEDQSSAQRQVLGNLERAIMDRMTKMKTLTSSEEIVREGDLLAADQTRADAIQQALGAHYTRGERTRLQAERDQAVESMRAPLSAFLKARREGIGEEVEKLLTAALKLCRDFDASVSEAERFTGIQLKRSFRKALVNWPGLYGLMRKLEQHINVGESFPELQEAKASNHGRL